jgi:ATP-dependent exoDNAse (exonuclease V) alpha subunit
MTTEEIIELVDSGRNIFITGAGGVGKTTSTNALLKYFDEKEIRYAMTATTGIASTQYETASTINRLTGIGIQTKIENIANIITQTKWRKEVFPHLRALDVILIDEISMMRPDTFELIDHVCREAKGSHMKPFGGIQMIFIGDLLQLPPVVKYPEVLPVSWVFQTKNWADLHVETVLLTKIHRQTDERFIMGLRRIRAGLPDHDTNCYFAQTAKHTFPEGIEPVRILSNNNEVDYGNAQRLSLLPGEIFRSDAVVWKQEPKYESQLWTECLASVVLTLKIGAQVMIIRNDKEGEYVNGTLGTYQGERTMADNSISLIIQVLNSDKIVYISKFEWALIDPMSPKDNPIKLATITQYPVKLAYFITSHKSQSLTLDYVEVNCSNFFAYGQIYVALSRARTYEGLRVLNWNPKNVKADPIAFQFYMDLAKPQNPSINQNPQ